jgi:hypothetical protein
LPVEGGERLWIGQEPRFHRLGHEVTVRILGILRLNPAIVFIEMPPKAAG